MLKTSGLRAVAFVRARWKRFALTAGLMAVFFGNQGFRGLVHNYMELRGLEREIASLEKEERHHAERLKLLKSGDASIERMARRELGYVRKGEVEYRFPPPSSEK